MKTKNTVIILTCLVVISFILTGCYRNKILFDEARAKQQLIPIEQAKSYQQNFISSREGIAKFLNDSSYLKKHFNHPNAELFNRDMIALLLNQEGADGIRVYYGEDEKGQIKLVLLPVDKNGNDIMFSGTSALSIPGISGAYAQGGYQAGENGQGCVPCTIK